MGVEPDPNRPVFRLPEVVAHYLGLGGITPCERLLFERHLRGGLRILDLGVGAGRTTEYLASIASRYVGMDYAEEMVAACRRRFPGLEILLGDAADLSRFADEMFDVVVFSFNGIDYLHPAGRRRRCLEECARVLREGGLLIFSTHNARAILIRPDLASGRTEEIVRRLAGARTALFPFVRPAVRAAKIGRDVLRAIVGTLGRTVRAVATSAFWRGSGYVLDPAHGGLLTHAATPKAVTAEAAACGFALVDMEGSDYPRASFTYWTPWHYFVFGRAGGRGAPSGGS